MKELDSRKFWTKADTFFVVFILVCWVLYEIVAGEAEAGEFIYTPDQTPITFDVQFEVRVDGELIDMGKLACPKTSLPKDFDPTSCPAGYECRVLPGTDNRKLREKAKKKYSGFVPSKVSAGKK